MSLTSASFEFIRATLRERSGQCLDDGKTYLVETRLLPVARRHGFDTVEAFVLSLCGRHNEKLLREVVEAMTINETFFFRDDHPFTALRQAVLPELIRHRSEVRSLNLWSAACSSGQEPYSLAMLINADFPGLAGWKVRIIASDISDTMLERARRGRYSDLETSRGLTPELLNGHFVRQGHSWQIGDDMRRMVEFLSVNLGGPWPELPPLDLVLLRNVLIYFDVPTKRAILARVRRVLRPGGYLVLGGAETTHNLDDAFRPVSFGPVSFFRVP